MAQLVLRHGSPDAHAYPLSGEVTTIGRNAGNDIVIDDPVVSRIHANVSRQEGGYALRDLNSSAGTHVLGRGRVSNAVLKHDDRIRIGDTELVFEQEEADLAIVPAVRALRSRVGATIVSLRSDEGAFDESAIAFKVPVPEHAATGQLTGRRASMLTRVATALQWVTDLDDVLVTLLDVVFELFQPDRGVILLKEPDSGNLVPRVSRPQGQELVISHTIIQYALEHRISVMVRQTAGDERFKHAQSIMAQSIRAAICCPLISRGRDLGTLYVDTQLSALRFNQEDLALFNLVAANAALAIDNAILLEEARSGARLAGDKPGPIVANSAAMQEVQARIRVMKRGQSPILISGEPGCGKLAAAMWLHRACHDKDAPFLAIDCSTLALGEAQAVVFGTEGAPAERPARRRPLGRADGRGALDVACGGMLVLEHVDALDVSFQEALLRRVGLTDPTLPAGSQVQLVATTNGNPGELVAGERLHPVLAQLPAANVLEMPPLRNRREDVIPLARYLLSLPGRTADAHAKAKGLTASAETALKTLQFRHHNAAELKDAIELAAVVADGPEIGAEHLFTGPKCDERRAEYEFGDSLLIRALVTGRAGRIVPPLVLAVFAALAVVCLVDRGGTAGQIANSLGWGLWWPSLVVLLLVVGRVWCAVCPFSQAGRFASRAFSLGRKPAAWMKKHTGLAMTVLFLAIIWSERFFRMPETPVATGVFLLVLTSCPVVLGMIYEREVWCRYLCPLGAISAGYAVASPVVVHANQTVCSSQCTTHDCSKGSAQEPGCPVFLHPLYVRDAHFCKLCFSCLRNCRHHSAKLYLRMPVLDIWKRAELSATLVPFSTVTFCVALIMLASQKDAWGTGSAAGFSLAVALAVAAGTGLGALLPRLLCGGEDRAPAARVAFALFIAAWGPLMAFHLDNIPGLDALGIHAATGSVLAQRFPTLDVPLLGMMQMAVIVLAAACALLSLLRIRQHLDGAIGRPAAWRWATLGVLCAAYVGLAGVLVLVRPA